MGDESRQEPEAPRRPLRRWEVLLRWAFRAVAVLLILLLFVLHVLPYITNTRFVRGRVVRTLEAFFQDAVVELETLRVAPLTRRALLITGFRIAWRDSPESPIISIGRLECRWRPAALLDGLVQFEAVTADSVHADVRREAGRWNCLAILRPRERPLRLEDLRLPLPVRVDAARASNVQLSLEMDGGIGASVRGIEAESAVRVRGVLEGVLGLRMLAESAEVHVGPARLDVGEGFEARSRVMNEGGEAQIAAALSAPALKAGIGGTVALNPVELAAALDARMDLNSLEVPSAALDLQVPGLVHSALTFALTRDADWHIEGEHLLAADLARLVGVLPAQAVKPLRSTQIGGSLFAVTGVAGRLRLTMPPEGSLQLKTQVSGADFGAQAELELADVWRAWASDEGPRLAGIEVAGLGFELTQYVDLLIGDVVAGLSATRVTCVADALRGAASALLDAEGTDMRADLSLQAALPLPHTLDLRGRVSLADATISSPVLGQVSMPMRLDVRARAVDALSPAACRIAVDSASGACGALVPGFRLAGSAGGLGRDYIAIRGNAVLDVTEAVGMLAGLTDDARAMLGSVAGEGAVGAALQVGGRLPSEGPGSFGVALDGLGVLRDLTLGRDEWEATVGAVDSLGSLVFSTDSGLLPCDVQAELLARGQGISAAMPAGASGEEASASLSLEQIDVDIAADLSGLDLIRVGARTRSSVQGLEAALPLAGEGPPATVGPLSFSVEGALEAQPLAGDIRLTDVRCAVPGLIDLAAPSFVASGFAGDGIEGNVRLDCSDLGKFVGAAAAALPGAMADKLPTVGGQARVGAKFAGQLPLVESLAAALETAGPLPAVELFPLKAFYERAAPLSVEARLSLADLTVAHEWPAGSTARAAGVAAEAHLHLAEGDLEGDLVVGIPDINLAWVPVPLTGLRVAAEFALRDFDEFEVGAFRLTRPGGIADVTGALRASGLSRLRGMPSPGDLLAAVDLTARSRGAIRPGGLPIMEGLAASGEVSWDAELALAAGQRLDLRLRPRLEDVAVSFKDLFAVSGLDGGLCLSKSLQVVTGGDIAGPGLSQGLIAEPPSPSRGGLRTEVPEFGTAADRLSPMAEGISIGSVLVLGREVMRDASIEVSARGGTFSSPQIYLYPLSGILVGTAYLHPVDAGREARVTGEFSGVDVRLMLPLGLRDFSGDASVSGSFGIDTVLSGVPAGPTAVSPLTDVAANVEITHIGAAALDRLLLALDPEAANPNIVRARRALLLANPVRARASLERTFVDVSVELEALATGLITEYSIPRFSIARLIET
ncbi:MAG: hypothetical protein ACYTFZ_05305, partial [Planctomycetota bacterium]